jgi:predicted enzyme related to lactoylglutathione lyase
MAATKLASVNLFTRDIERAKRFYTEGVGLEEVPDLSAPPSFVLLRAGACTLTLQDASAPGYSDRVGESIELGFGVGDVEAAAERLRAFGAEVGPLQQMGWGTAVEARDPDGHRLNVFRLRDEA